jgi:membrane protease YdiL (CAAX protease family)
MSSRARLGIGLLLSAAWFLSARLPVVSAYLRLLPVALVVLGFGLKTGRFVGPSGRAAGVGAAAGVAMVGLTYPAFTALVGVFPKLDTATAALYATSRIMNPALEIPALVLIVAAEEVLWRGLLFTTLEERWGSVTAVGVGTTIYSLAQSGSGSVLLAGVAFGCGLVWGLLRWRTQSVWASFLCHLLWTATVVVARPVIELA